MELKIFSFIISVLFFNGSKNFKHERNISIVYLLYLKKKLHFDSFFKICISLFRVVNISFHLFLLALDIVRAFNQSLTNWCIT